MGIDLLGGFHEPKTKIFKAGRIQELIGRSDLCFNSLKSSTMHLEYTTRSSSSVSTPVSTSVCLKMGFDERCGKNPIVYLNQGNNPISGSMEKMKRHIIHFYRNVEKKEKLALHLEHCVSAVVHHLPRNLSAGMGPIYGQSYGNVRWENMELESGEWNRLSKFTMNGTDDSAIFCHERRPQRTISHRTGCASLLVWLPWYEQFLHGISIAID